ncbi:M20 family metallopeptidase [Eubacterium sp. 1001713B170207_170306_E7]|uniref:M20 family metallopeptidase n=1 Tax=Eubacterium sp. 1001713B170207_170306_E7 TaxID=2787097 RepID=UPI001899B428|nr:M20 family metallopeptidase [Eubacterium sp. 1001713B170207_170306_E7]
MYSTNAQTLTRELVRIDSSDPGAYEGAIGLKITELLESAGVAVIREQVLPGRFNVMGKIEGEIDDPALIYICHMDTVTLGGGWSVPPLAAEIKNGRLYGRGACDMKSGLACALSVFLKAAASGIRPRHSFIFIGTVDEEDYMRGVEAAIASGWVTEKSWVLDTEPTNGQIQVAHKGRTWFELTADGITAHASTPWKGADAIAAMAEMIAAIRRGIAETPTHHDLGRSTVTFGQINGGYRPYVVPDHCAVTIDMRLVPPTTTAAAESIVKSAIRQAEKQIPGVKGHYRITGDRPFVEKNAQSFLLNALKESCEAVTGQPASVSFFPGYTDSAVIAGTLRNHNCLSYGPGDLELAHKPDEYVPLTDIDRCEKVLADLAERVLFD